MLMPATFLLDCCLYNTESIVNHSLQDRWTC